MLDRPMLRPVEYSNLVRLGPNRDGGYVVPEDQIGRCALLISLGLSDDWAFEREFISKNETARVVAVDHTVGPLWFFRRALVYSWKLFLYAAIGNRGKRFKYSAKLKNAAGYFSFFEKPHTHLRKKVSNHTSDSEIDIRHILDLNPSQSGDHDVFLKMDIEGAEYEACEDIVACRNRIRCIVTEFHDLDMRTDDFNRCMKSLLHYFYMVHVHGNNGARYNKVDNFPSVVEMTLVNKTLFDFEPHFSSHEYPVDGLDFPNNPSVPDYTLSFN